MEIYLLDMTKTRWEIRIYDKSLIITKKHIEILKKSDVLRYNEQLALSLNKEILKSYAYSIIDKKLNNLLQEVEYYKNMKVKVTRK